MIVKWQTRRYYNDIVRLECVRESAECVWINDRFGRLNRQNKRSEYAVLHDTWQAAWDHLNERTSFALKSATKNYNEVQALLKTKPTEAE